MAKSKARINRITRFNNLLGNVCIYKSRTGGIQYRCSLCRHDVGDKFCVAGIAGERFEPKRQRLKKSKWKI